MARSSISGKDRIEQRMAEEKHGRLTTPGERIARMPRNAPPVADNDLHERSRAIIPRPDGHRRMTLPENARRNVGKWMLARRTRGSV